MKRYLPFVVLLIALVLAACGGRAAATERPAVYMPENAAKGGEGVAQPEQPQAQPPVAPEAADEAKAAPGEVIYNTGGDILPDYARKVIKNAEIELLVKDSDVAIDGVTQMVGDMGGYIISSQVWYEAYNETNYKHATITIGVPSEQFETALRRLRNLALRVLNENASGQDVTDQYVDLQSQLTNLEATRDRIKSFLDDAKTVDEALRINQQLSEIEAQIEQVKGKMNYLADRSAVSTITITIRPDLPPLTPTPSPTPMPTPTPIPWKPGETVQSSWETLQFAYRGITDFLIWFFIVLVPILAPFVLVIWLVWRFVRRKPKA